MVEGCSNMNEGCLVDDEESVMEPCQCEIVEL